MTVRRLLAEADAAELAEWEAFDHVEGLADLRADARHGILCSLVASFAPGEDGTRSPGEFVPDLDRAAALERDPADVAAEVMRTMQMMASRHEGTKARRHEG